MRQIELARELARDSNESSHSTSLSSCFLTNFSTRGYHNLLFLSGSSPFTKYLQKCRVIGKCLCRIVSVGSLFYFFHKLASFCILSFRCLICSFMHTSSCILSLQVQYSQIPHCTPPIHPFLREI
jgi:hypothetical protein